MGRPLYSRTFKFSSMPAVREPEEPTYQRWSYLNAFDPDSDEFFASEHAVYEDFVDPVTPVNTDRSAQNTEEEVMEERDMLVVRMGNASPISSSEGSLSDSDSSFASTEHVDVLPDVGRINEVEESFEEPAVRVRLATRTMPVRRASLVSDWERPQPRRGHPSTATMRPTSYSQRTEPLAVPAPSAPIPVPLSSRRYATGDDRALPSPATPPRQTPITHFAMSPPPASTPRLYSWARNPNHSTSPSSSGPFTNPHARTSYTHLSPAFVRIRDVTV